MRATHGSRGPTLALVILLGSIANAQSPTKKVAIIVGPTNHPPGTHEVAAGGRLMKHCLNTSSNAPGIDAEVYHPWPGDGVLETADTVVFIGDTFPPGRLADTEAKLRQLGAAMDRGCGIVCVHYATGLRAEDVAPDGDHPLLRWMGGYFATGCQHHRSIAKIFESATIEIAASGHDICRGCQAFTLHDEPYINNYFGPDGNKLSDGVTAIATSMLPPEDPEREIVAWCIQRPDGGRGFGIVMPHFYRNWAIEDLRRLILNGIVWSANRAVPDNGVQSKLPDLRSFQPAATEPQPRKKQVSKATTAAGR